MGVSTDAKLVYGFTVDEDTEDHDKVHTFMDDRYKDLCDLEKRLDAQLVYHCSDAQTQYIVGLKTTYLRAWRGHPIAVDVKRLAELDRNEMDAKLVAIAQVMEIEPKPGRWLLCSYWG